MDSPWFGVPLLCAVPGISCVIFLILKIAPWGENTVVPLLWIRQSWIRKVKQLTQLLREEVGTGTQTCLTTDLPSAHLLTRAVEPRQACLASAAFLSDLEAYIPTPSKGAVS